MLAEISARITLLAPFMYSVWLRVASELKSLHSLNSEKTKIWNEEHNSTI